MLTWLVQVQDKAILYTWIPILAFKGKLLTQQFSELNINDVEAHAQHAQNASINRTVYNKVYLQMEK
jgi:bacteriorhodopsin